MDDMNVLVTGANGFVGKYLSAWLASRGFRIHALDINRIAGPDRVDNFLWTEFDSIPIRRMDAIIHLAGIAHDLKNVLNERDYFDVNVGLTKKVIDRVATELRKKDGYDPLIIFMSSVKACADTVAGVMTENDIPRPLTPYGRSKLLAEGYIRDRITSHYILRSCMVHGPGNKGNFNMLFKYSTTALPWPLGAFDNKRSFVSIKNLSYVIEKILLTKPEFGLYLVSDDEPISTNRLMDLLWKAQGKKPRALNIPPKIIIGLAKIGDKTRLPLNTERLGKLTESYEVSNGKLKKNLGIDRMPVTAENGFLETIYSFLGRSDI
jgi:nucleoside-diphosphate-sugar epimerase